MFAQLEGECGQLTAGEEVAIDGKTLQPSHAVRGHWSVENSCYYVLDVVFDEDAYRRRIGHSAENFALLRRLAHSLLLQEKTAKVGLFNNGFKAALDHRYLLKVLNLPSSKELLGDCPAVQATCPAHWRGLYCASSLQVCAWSVYYEH